MPGVPDAPELPAQVPAGETQPSTSDAPLPGDPFVPILPLCALGVAACFANAWRRIAVVALVLGVAVQLLGVSVAWTEFYRRVPYQTWAEAMTIAGRDAPVETLGRDNLDEVHFTIAKSPMVGQAWLVLGLLRDDRRLDSTCPWTGDLRARDVDYRLDWWFLAARGSAARMTALAIAAALLAGLAVCVRRVWQRCRAT